MMNTTLSLTELHALVDPVLELVVAKNQDYGGSMFEEGLAGIYVRMRDKISRLKRLVWENAEPQVKEETIRDVFKDLIGYSAGALAYMDRMEAERSSVAAQAPLPAANGYTLMTNDEKQAIVGVINALALDLQKARGLSPDNAAIHLTDAANRINSLTRSLAPDAQS